MNAESLHTLLWLATGTAGYWLTPARWRDLWLIGFSAVLLGRHAPYSLLALMLLAALTWLCAHGGRRPPSGRRLMGGAALILLALLGYRYASLDRLTGAQTNALLLGFAFYTLRLMHYLFEVYKGQIVRSELRTFLAWTLFFPSLTVGPIHRYPEFRRDGLRQRWDNSLFAEGLERILYGYVKIVVIANGLIGQYASPAIAGLEGQPALQAWLLCLEYGALLYFKFSGYSDIAIGAARLLGFRIMENFHWPFLATSIGDFWKRWHISLSSWCRDYAYLPVWSRLRSPALAALASMLVLGLWHELSWRYLLWGLYHGSGIMLWQAWQTRSTPWRLTLPASAQRLWQLLAWALTMAFVVASFAITREHSLKDGTRLLLRLFGA